MTPWWQTILGGFGAVLAAIIAGSFAVRNARKSPHETLKTLVEILDAAKQHIQPEDQRVLQAAVHREIQRIDRLNQARLEGFWTYRAERVRQFLAVEGFSVSMKFLPLAISLQTGGHEGSSPERPDPQSPGAGGE